MAAKTDIFIDVDGVINALGFWTGTPAGWDWARRPAQINARVEADQRSYRIYYAPELVTMLNDLAARDDVRMHWLTTWCSDAAQTLAPKIGLEGGDWTVIGEELFNGPQYNRCQVIDGVWWKWDAIQRLHDRNDRAVWLDDHLRQNYRAAMWAMKEGMLCIAPDEATGLTRANMERVLEYVNETARINA